MNAKRSPEEINKLRAAGELIEDYAYDDFRKDAFRLLGLLPSSEAVAVLGHFLDDPEGRNGKDILGNPFRPSADVVPFPPNCGAACIALSNIGIANPPVVGKKPERDTYFCDISRVDVWKAWWHEVKSGKHTYRFICSPIEYGPDGPVSKEVIQRVERNHEREAGHKKTLPGSENGTSVSPMGQPLFIAGIFAASALLSAAVWYYLKGRKAA